MKWPLDWEAKDYMKHLTYFNNKLEHGKEISTGAIIRAIPKSKNINI